MSNNKYKDVSFLWHACDQILDYKDMIDDEKKAELANKAFEHGVRQALRLLEDLELVEMCDIDRSPTLSDRNQLANMTRGMD